MLADDFLAVLDQVHQAGGVARIIPGQVSVFISKAAGRGMRRSPLHGGRKLTFLQEHSGVGVTLPAGGRYAEHAGHIARRSLNVLRIDGVCYIARADAHPGHAHWIKPNAHCVFALAHHARGRNSVDAR